MAHVVEFCYLGVVAIYPHTGFRIAGIQIETYIRSSYQSRSISCILGRGEVHMVFHMYCLFRYNDQGQSFDHVYFVLL